MCTVCGCGTDISTKAPGLGSSVAAHSHDHGREHSHPHSDHHHHDHVDGTIDFGSGIAGVDLPGVSQQRTIRIERDILSKNNAFAACQPRSTAECQHIRTQLCLQPRLRKDVAAGSRDQRPQGTLADGRDRRRSANIA